MDENEKLNDNVDTNESQPDADAVVDSTVIETNQSVTPDLEPVTLPMSDADVEPATSMTTPQLETPVAPAPTTLSESNPKTPLAAATSAASKVNNKQLILLIAGSVVLLLLVAVVALWLLGDKKESAPTDNTSTAPAQQLKLGVAITVADGAVEYMRDGDWQAVGTSTQIKEGDSVRTGADSRAVLTLDDGSAVRLDAQSVVRLADLTAAEIKIEQIEGTIYSRVVPNSDRRYIVNTNTTTYEALGTAFVTTKKATESGVQVYQSSVKASTSSETIGEGKQYYETSGDAALQGKVTDINIDALVDNAFINWNLSEDEKDIAFKEKLGILPQIKERADTKEKERLAAEEARIKAEKEAAARAAKEKEEKEKQNNHSKEKVERGTITSFNLVGDTFTWSYSGKAVHGYKLVFSKTNPPVFGAPGVGSVYRSGINETSGSVPKASKQSEKGKHYVRVCVYTAGTEDEDCVDYSPNVIEIIRK